MSAGARLQIGLLVGELVVVFAPVPTGDLTLLQIAVVSTAENRRGVLRQIQFENSGHAAGEKLTVVAHEHNATAEISDEILQAIQPIKIEVVGRLVEKDDVESREHQCRQSDPSRLPT